MHTFFVWIQIVSALALVAIVMSQASKSEGLSGTIGGKSESVFGRPGIEERLDEITKWAAITFMFVSALVSYVV